MSRRQLAAGGLTLAVAGGLWGAHRFHLFADYRTGTGERRSIALPDGSMAELSTATALSAAFGEGKRRLTLHYGEAFFKVAPDLRRPFVVETPQGRVTALGTAFALAQEGGRLTVTVTEHAVRVDAVGDSRRIEAGFQTVLDGSRIAAPVAIDDMAAALAWREGRLIFVNARLDAVVAALNRSRRGRLVVLGNTLGAQPVTLIVNLADIDDALRQLQDALPLGLIRMTPLLTLLHAA